MNNITDIADTLIKNAKQNPGLCDIRFIKAYNTATNNPDENCYTAVVSIESVKRSSGFVSRLYKQNTYGDVFVAKLNVRLYAGNDISGASLTKSALLIRNAMIESDSEGYIDSSNIGSIEYEKDSSAVYRDISFDIEYILCEAVV